MSFDPKAIANYFLDLADSEHAKIEPLKMQKLVYFAHGWYLAFTKNPLLNEYVEAWQYGPVIPDLYHEFKQFGSAPIKGRACSWRVDHNKPSKIAMTVPKIEDFCDEGETLDFVRQLLNRVWEVYKQFTGSQLSTMTHRPDTPWQKIRTESKGIKNADIPNELIRDYFIKARNSNAACK